MKIIKNCTQYSSNVHPTYNLIAITYIIRIPIGNNTGCSKAAKPLLTDSSKHLLHVNFKTPPNP